MTLKFAPLALAPALALAVTAGIGGLALAQGSGDMPKPEVGAKHDPNLSSPYAYAKSNLKAEELARQAEDDSAGRVIGGEVAADGAWPWQVGLIIAGAPVGAASQFCGGSLVLDQWVLTAAHCVHWETQDGGWQDVTPDTFSVLVGTSVLAPGQGDLIPVEAIFRHPEYDPTTIDNDIALVKLARAPQGVDYKTITVPDAEFGDMLDQPGVPTIVTGWGLTNGGIDPDKLYQAQIQMMSRDNCNSTLMEARANEAMPAFIQAAQIFELSQDDAQSAWDELTSYARAPLTENMVCSGSFEGGHTSCQGDSGGPLVVALDDGSYVQAGIVSWGLSSMETGYCSENAIFSAYTKISNYVGWLEQTINSN